MPATLEAPPAAAPAKPAAPETPAVPPTPDAPAKSQAPAGQQQLSPKERHKANLRALAEKRSQPPQARQPVPPPPTSPEPIPQTNAPPNPEPAKPPAEVSQASGSPEAPKASETPKEGSAPATTPDKKPNPWKIADQYKSRVTQLEKELADVKTSVVPEADRKVLTQKMEGIESENKRLRDEIRYYSYEKSPEFQEKHHKPYVNAISRAISEFDGLQVQNADGSQRAVTADDIVAIASAPFPQAKELAAQLFGDAAADVMAYRPEIRRLFAERQAALDEWKKTGESKLKEMADKQQAETAKLNERLGGHWKQNTEALFKDEKWGKFFSPVEGDQEGNQRLAKGFELVDRAFKEDPREPGISPEESARRAKRHAAVWARAAGFGRLAAQYAALEAKLVEVEKKLKSYTDSEPATTGRQPTTGTTPTTGHTKESVIAGLRKLVRT